MVEVLALDSDGLDLNPSSVISHLGKPGKIALCDSVSSPGKWGHGALVRTDKLHVQSVYRIMLSKY